MAGDPVDPLVFYMGTAHGGVWKTTDAGLTWRNVSDDYFRTSPVGAIDVSRSERQGDLRRDGRVGTAPGPDAG